MKFCIHIQTHLPHFDYTNKLIHSFLKMTNINELRIPIFIVLDSADLVDRYKNKYKYDYDLIYYLNITEILNTYHLRHKENKEDLFKRVINAKWGSGGHRNYVAVKRCYSLLKLENIGYEYVWCLDSESLVLRKTDIQKIIDSNKEVPILVVGNKKTGVRYPCIVEKILQEKYDNYRDITIRMNDFWFIHMKYFKSMIDKLYDIHKSPLSYFINGSEQSLYEYYLYSKYLNNSKSIKLINIYGDLHGNHLFNKIIKSNKKIDIDKFCTDMNNKYFNYVQSYRGDYYKKNMTNIKGKYIMEKLNINIAVSNYSGI